MRVLVMGAGGHARVVISLMASDPAIQLAGVLDRTDHTVGEACGSSRIVGTFDELRSWHRRGVDAVALAFGDNRERAKWYAAVRELGVSVLTLRHNSAIVEETARLGQGVTLCAGSIIGADVVIGDAVIVNTSATIDHECRIGDFAHIAPGCHLAGRVRIGESTALGIGCVVKDDVTIGSGTVVGAGSVVVCDIPNDVVVYGVPAKVRRHA